jgi:phospholipid transport system substrate-binding protein
MTTSIRRACALLLTGAILACGVQSQSYGQGAPAPAAAQGTTQSPSDVVQNSAQSMLRELDANREMYRKDPSKIGQLVDKYLLPNFDVEFAARLVLGKYWRTATPEQRKRFIDAFYHSLLNNYGNALSDFTADKLKIFPTNVDPKADRATVRTEVKRSNGDRISVNYYMHKTPTGWKAWDVVIDGISYVNSYREDFGAQIDKQGIDSVIDRLEKGEKPGEIGKTTGDKKTS